MHMNTILPMDDQALELERIFHQQKEAYSQQPYPSLEQRKAQLQTLKELLVRHQDEIAEAISQDFSNRSKDETLLFELMTSISGIKHSLKNLKKWMKPEKRDVGILFQPAKAYIRYQPVGVVGVVVPWNYPLFLAVGPLAQAIAAGNRVMLKMSEFTPVFSALFKRLIAENFSDDQICVVTGDAQVAQSFTALGFDHLLFTGATSIGKHVLRAAAENMTPVTLELGGKSPAVVASDAELTETAKRIVFGKAMNAGQTCVAPDYAFVHSSQVEQFITAYKAALEQFYPGDIQNNPDYTAIISERQFLRLQSYLTDAEQKGANVILLKGEDSQRRMAHRIVAGVSDDMLLMQNEIFGPVLPVVAYQSMDEVIEYINGHDRPLALYYFGYNKAEQQRILNHTHSGGVCLNETLLHVGQEDMPFGGIGPSGMGHYHGVEGFKTFSHAKSVFERPKFSMMKLVYPPYGTAIQQWIYKLFIGTVKKLQK
ncbi:coniferyl aldehyde dehydrogenase [Acinetobacter sp. WCHAc010052]|nr:coniferyl aldehyde dehydrogenase [Acinetobacter sp. WCHAc010052]